jgi:hypothetical protein
MCTRQSKVRNAYSRTSILKIVTQKWQKNLFVHFHLFHFSLWNIKQHLQTTDSSQVTLTETGHALHYTVNTTHLTMLLSGNIAAMTSGTLVSVVCSTDYCCNFMNCQFIRWLDTVWVTCEGCLDTIQVLTRGYLDTVLWRDHNLEWWRSFFRLCQMKRICFK